MSQVHRVIVNKWITQAQFTKKPYTRMFLYSNITPSSQERLMRVLGDYPREVLPHGANAYHISMGKKVGR